jgi:hypothetical protein
MKPHVDHTTFLSRCHWALDGTQIAWTPGIQEPRFLTRIGVGYTLPLDRIPSDPRSPSAAQVKVLSGADSSLISLARSRSMGARPLQ